MRNLRLMCAVIGFMAFALQPDRADAQVTAMDDQNFVTKASSSNTFEIEAGKLAETKGESDQVKEYGSHMVKDHTTVGTEMSTLAASEGWNIPEQLQAKEQANLDKLNSLSGAEFDREFANTMVVSHQEAVMLFTTASGDEGVSNERLKSFAKDKLPALKKHLEKAKALKERVVNN